MKNITLNNIEYEVINNINEGFDEETLTNAYTDYFAEYDIVVGDWAYNKLRLKGFNEKNNKYFKPINDAAKIEDYIKTNCAYGCKWFAIKKK